MFDAVHQVLLADYDTTNVAPYVLECLACGFLFVLFSVAFVPNFRGCSVYPKWPTFNSHAWSEFLFYYFHLLLDHEYNNIQAAVSFQFFTLILHLALLYTCCTTTANHMKSVQPLINVSRGISEHNPQTEWQICMPHNHCPVVWVDTQLTYCLVSLMCSRGKMAQCHNPTDSSCAA